MLVKAVKPKTLRIWHWSLAVHSILRYIRHTREFVYAALEWLLSIFSLHKGQAWWGWYYENHWLLGLQLWHVLNNAPWHGSTHLNRAIQGLLLQHPPHPLVQGSP